MRAFAILAILAATGCGDAPRTYLVSCGCRDAVWTNYVGRCDTCGDRCEARGQGRAIMQCREAPWRA